ncbi:MAG: DUF2911 domain-containing protein [Saprospiraceae bacterium]|nr:DUF2911 domain-containing protein [Saprospiraceae bacterium]
MSRCRNIGLIILTLFASSGLPAQIETPLLSPRAKIEQEVGFTKVNINYSRPSMRQRIIFDNVVPYGKLWRTGANECTTMAFSEDVRIGGEYVPAGKYSLLTIPKSDKWVVILNLDTTLIGTDGYVSDQDIVRIDVKSEILHDHVETFTIDIGEVTQSTANIRILWENTIVKFLVSTDADRKVMKQIEASMRDPITKVGQMYYTAANYFFNTHRDMDQALEWVNKSLEINGNQYWVLRLKSQILAEKSDFRAAIRVARLSMDLAEKDQQEGFVQMNKKAIEQWQKMHPHE